MQFTNAETAGRSGGFLSLDPDDEKKIYLPSKVLLAFFIKEKDLQAM
jgi:hypothetical protein